MKQVVLLSLLAALGVTSAACGDGAGSSSTGGAGTTSSSGGAATGGMAGEGGTSTSGGGGASGGSGGSGGATVNCEAPLVDCGGHCADLLTGATDCGQCGHDCLGGSCAAGACAPMVLATGLGPADSLALDATHVYVGSADGLVRVPKIGGAAQALAGGGVTQFSVAVDGGTVYFGQAGSVLRMPADGSSLPTLLASAGGLGNRGLALDAQSVYFTLTDFQPFPPLSKVVSVPRAGGAMSTLASSVINATTLSVLGDQVYVATGTYNGKLYSVPVAGGSATALADYGTDLYFVAAHATGIYMANCAKGAVTRVPLGGGAETTVATGACPAAIAFDADHLYFTESVDPGSVTRVPLAGGPAEKIAGDAPWSLAIAVDDQAVYFTNYMAGTLLKLAK